MPISTGVAGGDARISRKCTLNESVDPALGMRKWKAQSNVNRIDFGIEVMYVAMPNDTRCHIVSGQ